jgi:hypothetical protein
MTQQEALAADLRRLLRANGVKVEPASAEEREALLRRASRWAESKRKEKDSV